MDYKTLDNYFYYNQQIAQGSFSVIYRGYQLSDRKPVAVKKITKHVDKKYINSEINIMRKLNHVNILKLYDVITHHNKLYLILEYCNKGDLLHYIRSKETLYDIDYIKQIISGLKYLYNNTILHRDIKPQNILINNHTIKICDFGFAKNIKDNDLLNTFCGSPLYMAPEILKYREYTDKSDIWSLGVIIYEILFKKHPYMSTNQIELIKKIKEETIIIEDCVLNTLLTNMLVNDPNKRINWNDIFSKDWFDDSILEYKECFSTLDNSPTYLPDNKTIINEDIDLTFSDLFNSKSDSLRVSYNDSSSSEISIDEKNPIINKSIDCEVYSHSAPNQHNYLENYINNKSKNIKPSYKILGTSPKLTNSAGLYSCLSKSVGTIKNLFGS